MTTTEPTTGYLDVPGARICYEVRGAGPPLLFLGAPMGSRGFAPIAPLLAEDHTVVTFDPRGIMRSTDADPDSEVAVETMADDVHRLLSEVDAGPAAVFANSGGAAVGLALLAAHPGQVRALVAHEPPLVDLLPDGDALREAFDDVRDTYAGVGRNEALKKYAALTGVERFSRPPGGGRHEVTDFESFTPPDDVRVVLDSFFLRMLRPTAYYRVDPAALRALEGRVVVGAGVASRGHLAHRAAVALAAALDAPVVDFPGDHTGFQGEPGPFADVLRRVLARG